MNLLGGEEKGEHSDKYVFEFIKTQQWRPYLSQIGAKHHNYFTYILTNYNRTVLYTGVTNDIEKRLYEHYFGKNQGSSFTSKYKCFYLIWYERHQYINHAIEREKEIKGWTRAKKVNLIVQENPGWAFLNNDIMEWPPINHHAEHGGH